MSSSILQMEPLITEADCQAVQAYMKSGGWLTEFEQTRLLEQSICNYTGARFCLMAPSGTLALFLALSATGIGPGDEVIVPDYTMAASATAVMLTGAKVVFVDIARDSLCLDLELSEAAITDRTKAIIFVSLNGRAPQTLSSFITRCHSQGVKVIEDAAQSLGSFLSGRHLGTFGDCGCFSFSSQKIITTGQGGAVITDNESMFRKMLQLRDFGRPKSGSDHYQSVGWNFKFTDLQAVVGLSQMSRIELIVKQKKELFRFYHEGLSGVSDIEIPVTDLNDVTPWFIDILVDKE